jgi:thiaminase/transcriptional activator TenA
MPFNKMLAAITPNTLTKIVTHPFNVELGRGILPPQKYSAFLEQDRLYLMSFAEALKHVAVRLPRERHQHLFHRLSEEAFKTQINLHGKYFLTHKTPNLFQPAPLSLVKIPVVFDYTAYLLTTAKNDPIEVAVGSLIPCFFIYSHLGRCMRPTIKENNPYRLWIESYSNERFLLATQSIIQTIKELFDELPAPDEETTVAAFIKSTEFEMAFWDAIYGASYADRDEISVSCCSRF